MPGRCPPRSLTGTVGGDRRRKHADGERSGRRDAQTLAFAGAGLLTLVPTLFSPGEIDGLALAAAPIEPSGIADADQPPGIVNGDTLAIQQSAGPTISSEPSIRRRITRAPCSWWPRLAACSSSPPPGLTGPTVIGQGETVGVTGAGASTLAAITGGSGGILVTGAGSSLNTTTGSFIVGDSGLGSLAVEADGGASRCRPAAIDRQYGRGVRSLVDVSGAGSDLRVTGTLIVGDAGSGALSLAQGASATVGALDVAGAATGDGDVSLAGAGTTLDVTGALTLGDQAAGELSILGGAWMTIGTGGVVGSSRPRRATSTSRAPAVSSRSTPGH